MPLIHGTLHKGVIQEFPNNGTHCVGGWNYYVANLPTGQIDANGSPIYANFQISKNAGMYSTDNLGNVTEIALFPQNLTLTTSSATLDNVTVWSANSILTRDYADARYAPVSALIDGGTALSTSTGTFDGGSAIAN